MSVSKIHVKEQSSPYCKVVEMTIADFLRSAPDDYEGLQWTIYSDGVPIEARKSRGPNARKQKYVTSKRDYVQDVRILLLDIDAVHKSDVMTKDEPPNMSVPPVKRIFNILEELKTCESVTFAHITKSSGLRIGFYHNSRILNEQDYKQACEAADKVLAPYLQVQTPGSPLQKYRESAVAVGDPYFDDAVWSTESNFFFDVPLWNDHARLYISDRVSTS
jgi:hypothetical protein